MPSSNDGLASAKKAKNDEFYTLYEDIQKEINAYIEFNPDVFKNKTILCPCDDPEWSNFTKFFAQNFEAFGLKKLISTSYSADAKMEKYAVQGDGYQTISLYDITEFEQNNPRFDENITHSRGKIFVLERDINNSGNIDINDLEWNYLDGDGDFQSEEVTNLRDEADIIITNPPFSLFNEFFAWCLNAGKQFMLIGNINCITYKEIFCSIQRNEVWLGNGMGRWISGFIVPESYELYGTEARIENGQRIVATNNCLWLTNIEHGRRHQPLSLMTMADNLRYSSHKVIKDKGYLKYDYYDAIDIPYTDAIPRDYLGLMGVPITFLDKYCPDQFEILGCSYSYGDPGEPWHKPTDSFSVSVNGESVYKRIFIKYTDAWVDAHKDIFDK